MEAYHEGAVRGLDSPGWGRAYMKLRTWSSCREPTHAPGSAGVARNLNKPCEWSPRQFPSFYLELWLCWMVTLVGGGEGGLGKRCVGHFFAVSCESVIVSK